MSTNESTGDAALDELLSDFEAGRPVSIDPILESDDQRRRREISETLDRYRAETAAGTFQPTMRETVTVAPTREEPTGTVAVTPPPSPSPPSIAVAAASTTAASPSPGPSYRFPDQEPQFRECLEKLSGWHADQVRDLIERLSDGPSTYDEVRHPLCAASIALNRMRVCPPSLRRARRAKPLPTGTRRPEIDTILVNDRQVTDLHWIAFNWNSLPDPRWRGLFRPGEFDFALASRFAAERMGAERKASLLHLSSATQHLLGQIQSKAVRERWRRIEVGRAELLTALHDPAMLPRRRMNADTMELLPNAYVALEITAGQTTAAVRFMKALCGKSVTSGWLSERKKWLIASRFLQVSGGGST